MDTPLYRKLYNDIKNQIVAGVYREGDILPSENELCTIHKVTRTTIRQALSELSGDGFITKKKGLGSVVIKQQRRTLGILSIKGFSEAVSDVKLKVNTFIIIKPKLKSWDDNFIFPISDIEKSAGCIFLERVRCVGETPVMIESTYLANLNLPKFCNSPFQNNSLFETLNVRYQIEITKVEQDMRAVLADEKASKLLNTKVGAPLLQIYLKFHTSRPYLYIYGLVLCNTENFSIGNKT